VYKRQAQACQVLEDVVNEMVEDVKSDSEKEEHRVMLFQQLIELIAHNGIEEEGSRRLFLDCMQSFVVNVVTPDILLPHCFKAISKCSGSQAITARLMDRLHNQLESRDLHELGVLRLLTTASNLLDSGLLEVNPRPYLDHSNPCIRLAAVECVGKMGLYQKPTESERQNVLDIANNHKNSEEVRSQAALTLSDWSLVHKTGMDEPFRKLVSDWMSSKHAILSTIACEIAMKQPIAQAVRASDWIGTLIFNFFEPVKADDEEHARLQQLSALFFTSMARVNGDVVVC